MGTVKWYNAVKGFGFIVLDGGGNDVFVHVSALERAGIMGLSEGQRVYVGVAEGQKKDQKPLQSKWRTERTACTEHPTVGSTPAALGQRRFGRR
jgi:CspA family cold shock protein